ncbi:alpha/beta hydrolase [Actinosynnema sp. NPDC047251]|uniref:Alpha/beta hydrolase fold containing protein n=1 Tax=Saccharothrix espanaensis (strain ATCC 51144 / DSM 44229 / JCM 9112 / NBRC 15066 / NRRL 15764) TaxID=1179773 RepID=K0KAJ8_SACES|nr:alpha/beta hydrolase [Saccharothrix espanaensis]CCH34547.1 alpha/beta hydrolase fold containing protein [Saccharothrix espanaensis DSM 44229]
METLPLVLLHAFPLDGRMWDGVRAVLDPITPDLRGRGREPDLGTFADDVLRDLDRRGLERVVVGGCSMGGYVAMALLRRAPDRVAGLVLADTRCTADDDAARAGRLAMADRVLAQGVGWLPDGLAPGLVGPSPAAGVVERVAELVLAQPAAEVAWAQRAMAARPDSRDVLAAVDVPALVLVGSEDALTPPAVARDLADVLRAEYVELPGVGHLTPVEAPEAFAAAVLDWRTRVGR